MKSPYKFRTDMTRLCNGRKPKNAAEAAFVLDCPPLYFGTTWRIMANLTGFIKQLRKERDRVEQQLSGLNAALTAFVGVYGKPKRKRRRKLSAKSRAKISRAQKKRWRAWKARHKS